MSPVIAALTGALIVAGLLGIVAGLRPSPVRAPRRTAAPSPLLARWHRISGRTRALLGVGIAAGVVIALATGWLVAVIVVPVTVAGVPLLLSKPSAAAQIARLDAMEEWTRNLAGVLTVGVGLEQAMAATLRSTPAPIRPDVTRLVGRLRARWTTRDAIHAFADDLDDATGDLIAANLLLGADRRGPGLAPVLEALAESVAADVDARRKVEADRNKPRSSARIVTAISLVALVALVLTGDYVQPYATPLGQLILLVLLSAYGAMLVWMRAMAATKPTPRFLTASGGFRRTT